MKSISFICLILCILSFEIKASNPNITTVTKVKDFSMGLALGLGALKAMPEATTCVMNQESLVKNIELVIAQIKHLDIKNFKSEIFPLLKLQAGLVKEINSALQQCGSLPSEGKAFFQNIVNHFTKFTYRIQGVKNIFDNFAQVEIKVKTAISFIKIGEQATDYLTAGALIGQTINIYVNGVQNSQQNQVDIAVVTKISDFTKGLAIGLGARNQMPEATACFKDSETLINDFQSTISDLKNFSIKEVVPLVKVLAGVVKQVNSDFQQCQRLPSQGKAFFLNIETHFTNKSLEVKGIKNLVMHFETVFKNIKEAVDHIKYGGQDNDYFVAGTLIGQTINIYINDKVSDNFLGQY